MADIFISYAHEDWRKAAALVSELEKRNLSVWWDKCDLRVGNRFDTEIDVAITNSCCVIVLWSKVSVSKQWVRDEATAALELDILMPVLLEDVQIPIPFKRIHSANLIGWKPGSHSHEHEFNILMASIDDAIAKRGKSKKPREIALDKKVSAIKQRTLFGELVKLEALLPLTSFFLKRWVKGSFIMMVLGIFAIASIGGVDRSFFIQLLADKQNEQTFSSKKEYVIPITTDPPDASIYLYHAGKKVFCNRPCLYTGYLGDQVKWMVMRTGYMTKEGVFVVAITNKPYVVILQRMSM